MAQAKNALDGKPIDRRVEVERSTGPERPDSSAGNTPEMLVERVEEAEEVATPEEEIKATDAAARKAEELNVDLSSVTGTGQGGRITVGDVEKAARKAE